MSIHVGTHTVWVVGKKGIKAHLYQCLYMGRFVDRVNCGKEAGLFGSFSERGGCQSMRNMKSCCSGRIREFRDGFVRKGLI